MVVEGITEPLTMAPEDTLRVTSQSEVPTDAGSHTGEIVYNTTDNCMYVWQGAQWVAMEPNPDSDMVRPLSYEEECSIKDQINSLEKI